MIQKESLSIFEQILQTNPLNKFIFKKGNKSKEK